MAQAWAPVIPAVVTFCDSRGIRALVLAHEHAITSGSELRLVVPSTGVVRMLDVLGRNRWPVIYPSLPEALAVEPAPKR